MSVRQVIGLFCASRGIPLLGPSGSSAHLRGVADALHRRGDLRIAVATLRDSRGAHDVAPNVPVIALPPRQDHRCRNLGAWFEGRALAAHLGAVDLLWERHAPPATGMGIPSRIRVVQLDAPGFERWGRNKAGWSSLEACSLGRADRVIAVSSWLAEWASRCCQPDRIRVVPNGAEVLDLPSQPEARQRLGVQGPVIGFVGSSQSWQGIGRLPAILDAFPEAVALVAGPGPKPLHPRLKALPPLWGADKAALYAAVDVLVAPYDNTAPPWLCPLKRVDAASAGRPLVLSQVGSVTRAERGELILPPTAAAEVWAEAIRSLVGTHRPRVHRLWSTTVDEAVGDVLSPPN